jgi:predicted ester cyclase
MKPSLSAIVAAAGIVVTNAAIAAEMQVVQPKSLVADASLSKAALNKLTLAALRYDTFWSTGDESWAKLALSPDFVDHTLPAGRPQGPSGAILASKAFRAAVPDLSCDVEQMIAAGNRVTAFLHFRGHFTGTFKGHTGQGQAIDFIAIDIYGVQDGVIVEDWHLEDNLTLMRQFGIVGN